MIVHVVSNLEGHQDNVLVYPPKYLVCVVIPGRSPAFKLDFVPRGTTSPSLESEEARGYMSSTGESVTLLGKSLGGQNVSIDRGNVIVSVILLTISVYVYVFTGAVINIDLSPFADFVCMSLATFETSVFVGTGTRK